MLMLMLMFFFVDDHYVCSSVAGLLCSTHKDYDDGNRGRVCVYADGNRVHAYPVYLITRDVGGEKR